MNPPRTKSPRFPEHLLIFDVLDHISHISMSNSTYKVTTRPKAICPYGFIQIREYFFQLFGSPAFNQLHNLRGTVRWFGFKEQMDVILLDRKFDNLKFINLRTKTNHAFQSLFNLTYQSSSPVFGNKGKVITNIVGGMTSILKHFFKFTRTPNYSFLCLSRMHSSHALIGRGFLQ